jgi:hypothetical protein
MRKNAASSVLASMGIQPSFDVGAQSNEEEEYARDVVAYECRGYSSKESISVSLSSSLT